MRCRKYREGAARVRLCLVWYSQGTRSTWKTYQNCFQIFFAQLRRVVCIKTQPQACLWEFHGVCPREWDSELERCTISHFDGNHASVEIYLTKCYGFVFHPFLKAHTILRIKHFLEPSYVDSFENPTKNLIK